MAWCIDMKPGEIVTINGCRIVANGRPVHIALLDRADVLLPSGRFFPAVRLTDHEPAAVSPASEVGVL